jgi:hypothetical protein
MDEKTKADLERLFGKDKERVAAVAQAADAQAERESASLAKFTKISG